VVAAIVISEVVPGHRDLEVGGGLLLGIHRCLLGSRFSTLAVKGPVFERVVVWVAVQDEVREFMSSPRTGRYSKVASREELSPMSSSLPSRVATEPVRVALRVSTWGGAKAGSTLVSLITAGLGQRKLS
jgi:hypothetical protein